MRKQEEFLWSKVQRNARARRLVTLRVEFQILNAQMFRLLLGSTPQHRADTGESFRKRERFDKIIVCTQLEAFHTIADAVAGGKKQNGRADCIAPQFRDDVPSILVW